MVGQRRRAVLRWKSHQPAGLPQQPGVRTVVPAGAHDHRDAPCGGFEHGMEPSGPETPSDERQATLAIEMRQWSHLIQQEKWFGAPGVPTGAGLGQANLEYLVSKATDRLK